MTTFRIREHSQSNGVKHYYVQQQRWFLFIPWWSDLIYTYEGSRFCNWAPSLKEAEDKLQQCIEDAHKKRAACWRNIVRRTVKQQSV